MPLKASYSEAELATFMVGELGATGAELGLTAISTAIAGSGGAVLATARLLDDDIADLTDMAVLEVAARWQAWLAAEAALLASPNKIKAGSAELTYDQRLEGIRLRMARAESAYYAAVAEAEAASGSIGSYYFSLAGSCRGR